MSVVELRAFRAVFGLVWLLGCQGETSGSECAGLVCADPSLGGVSAAGDPGVSLGAGTTSVGGASAGGTGEPGLMVPDPISPLPNSYEPQLYTLPEPDDAVECSGKTSASAVVERVFFAQTHVMEPTWPLFFLVANRPALVEAVVTGSGPAPDVRIEAFVGGEPIGALCMNGPDTLASRVDLTVHQTADRYTVTLPSAWLKPDLSVRVTAGASQLTFSAAELGLGAAPEMNLVMLPMDVLNYNDGKEDVPVPDTWLSDFAGAVPASVFRFGMFPARLALPSLAVSPDGNAVPPVVLNRRPCRNSETEGAECVSTDVPVGNINAAALRLIEAVHRATGEFAYTYYYGNTENFFPGGWGGGKNFVGADFGGVFIHEMGHALSLPHWGQGAYQNTMPSETQYRYPYGGNADNGGGRGESWNYYQNIGEFVSPLCQDADNDTFGLERSDAMQRSDHCAEWRSSGKGPWDGFGDFSAFAIFRFMVGAETNYLGEVSYRGGSAPFHLSRQRGFPNLEVDAQGQRRFVRAHQPLEESREERFDFLVPQQWEGPVSLIYGSYHPEFSEANVVYAPVSYVGTLPKVLDPTDAQTFGDLAARNDGPYEGFFWQPRDMTLKITYQDGRVLHALYPHGSVRRDWTLGSGPWRNDLLYFALVVPGDQPIQSVELYHRPFVVRRPGDMDEGNIANPELGVTAQNFMDDASLVTAWQRN